MPALLILPLDPLLDPVPLLAPLRSAVARSATSDQLAVLLVPTGAPPPARLWKALQRLLGAIYSAAVQAKGEDAVLGGWEVDVLVAGLASEEDEARRWSTSDSWDAVWRIEGDETPLPAGFPSIPPSQLALLPALQPNPAPPPPPTSLADEGVPFQVVALGGSFDHLHPGHKILLSTALFLASRKIIVGVSSSALLTKKAFAPELEPLAVRLSRTERFCRRFRPGLQEYDVVPIDDVYGPTATEADIQALVLSRETVAGGQAVDKKRVEASLPPLKTFVIDVISSATLAPGAADADAVEHKMSSTEIRRWLAAHRPAAHAVARDP